MRIHVGNIRWSASDGELRAFFARSGEVASVEIVRNPFTGRSRGFGFVEMPNDNEAALAIQQFDGAEFRGLRLRVGQARPRSTWGPRPAPY
jgi:RNA recognition motif-containing protein